MLMHANTAQGVERRTHFCPSSQAAWLPLSSSLRLPNSRLHMQHQRPQMRSKLHGAQESSRVWLLRILTCTSEWQAYMRPCMIRKNLT